MIETTAEVQQAIEQMGRMQRILESYRADILAKNPRNFGVFAEGPFDEIQKKASMMPAVSTAMVPQKLNMITR